MSDWTPKDDGAGVVLLGKRVIGAAVRSARLGIGLSQHQLSRRAGLDQSVISRLETGKLNGIRWQTLARLVGVLESGRPFRFPRDPRFPRDDADENP